MRRMVIVSICAAVILAAGAYPADFPDIDQAERALTEVPGYPRAPAVVLFEVAEVDMMRYPTDISNVMSVHRRLKILGQQGVEDHSTVEIVHSRWLRLRGLEGRTVHSDGTVLPLSAADIFEQTTSRRHRQFVTRVAFPAVEIGSIVEYRYDLYWDSPLITPPWLFNNRIPTLRSEITYKRPDNLFVKSVGNSPPQFPLQHETSKEIDNWNVTVWVDNPPAIPEEPMSYPFEDMASYFMLIPEAALVGGEKVGLLESWERVSDLVESQIYGPMRRGRSSRKKASEIASQVEGSKRAKAEAVYRFVRDELRSEGFDTILPKGKDTCDDFLAAGSADGIRKVILLQHMLAGIGVDSQIAWTRSRLDGEARLEAVSLLWFTDALLRAEIEGKHVFLQPYDEHLSFGSIAPDLAGSRAVVVDRRQPETISLPERPFEENQRVARVDLALLPDGGLQGAGSVEFHGYHAYHAANPGASTGDRVDRWRGWLEERFVGFDASDIHAAYDKDEEQLTVTFAVSQRPEEVLGDQAQVLVTDPLRLVDQPLVVEPEERRTPVLVAFADLDQVQTTLTWPQGWRLDAALQDVRVETGAGFYGRKMVLDESERRATVTRKLGITTRSLEGRAAYRDIRDLLVTAEANDAEGILFSSG